jgi:hypothetical protein
MLMSLLPGLLPGCAAAQTTESAPAPAEKAALRVLTLGDSITAAFRYQPFLREALKDKGVQVTFVGSQGEGEKKHQGHSGGRSARSKTASSNT